MTTSRTLLRYGRALVAAAPVLVAGTAALSQPADLLMTGGRIYVGGGAADESVPQFREAVAIKDGAIVFVGSAEEAKAVQPARTVDLKGKLVLPGFIDAHVHAALAGVEQNYCSIEDATELAELDAIVKDCLAAEQPGPDEWSEVIMLNLVGKRIPIEHWDGLRNDGPMVVYGADGHTLYANSAALKAAGVSADATAPAGGSLDLSQGFFVDAAMDLVRHAIPEEAPEETEAKYLTGALWAMRYLNAVGVTGIREATSNEPQLLAYERLARDGRVTLRSEQSIKIDPKGEPKSEIGRAAALRERFSGVPFMTVNSLKVFADGVIEYPAQTAALLEPYLDPATGQPGPSRGELLIDPQTIEAVLLEADRQGFDIHAHAIGDWAVRATLDAYEAVRRTAGPGSRKLSIAHLELVHPDDFRRFKELQVSANFQLFWALPESYTIDALLPFIGPDRHRWIYPTGSLLEAGAPLSAGSDGSVSTPDPMAAIRMAVLRTDPYEPGGYKFEAAGAPDASDYVKSFDGTVYAALHEEERLPVKAVIDAYTIGSAREVRLDHLAGSIAVGKRADLVVLNHDVFEVAERAPDEIDEIRVCWTYFEGRQVYAHDDPDEPLERGPAEGCD